MGDGTRLVGESFAGPIFHGTQRSNKNVDELVATATTYVEVVKRLFGSSGDARRPKNKKELAQELDWIKFYA